MGGVLLAGADQERCTMNPPVFTPVTLVGVSVTVKSKMTVNFFFKNLQLWHFILPEMLIGAVVASLTTFPLALNTETVQVYFPACLVLSITVTFVTGVIMLGGT